MLCKISSQFLFTLEIEGIQHVCDANYVKFKDYAEKFLKGNIEALKTSKHLWKNHIISLLLESLLKKLFCRRRKMWLNLIKIILGRVGKMVCFDPYRDMTNFLYT